MAKDTYVYVVVDTKGIIGSPNPSDFVVFSDNRGAIPGTGSGFISDVQKGKLITWCGIVKDASNPINAGDSVAIKEISMKAPVGTGGIRALGLKTYKERSNSGVVYGRGRSSGWINGGIEMYNIIINVNGTDYPIDPQLKMIP